MCATSQRNYLTELKVWKFVGRLQRGKTRANVAETTEVSRFPGF